MKRSTKNSSNTKRRYRKNSEIMVKGTLANHLTMQLNLPLQSFNPSLFQKSLDFDADDATNDRDFIRSQDFFCTPDYITPEMPATTNNIDSSMENIICPKSPEKIKTVRSKRQKLGNITVMKFVGN